MCYNLPGKMKRICSILILTIFLYRCTPIDVTEQSIAIPKMEWQQANICSGSFNVTDTINIYNFYITLRHTDAYSYNNIWLNVGTKAPNDSAFTYQKINMPLGNDAVGWYGNGMNDIWETQHKLNPFPSTFKKTGVYNFSIEHIMRDNPLPHVLNVGFKVQKAN
jgi:gliding motility-associated lipoprotein GldH